MWIAISIQHNAEDEEPHRLVIEATPGAEYTFSDLYEADGTIQVFATREDAETWLGLGVDEYEIQEDW